jgi:hypothetical protein
MEMWKTRNSVAFTIEFFVVSVHRGVLENTRGVWGLIVSEKPNLFASHKNIFAPHACYKLVLAG